MRYLITGASGQLGSYLLKELAAGADTVIAWSGSKPGQQSGHLLHAVDLTNRDAVVAAYRDARPDAVIHSAALSTVGACYQDPPRAAAVNVAGTGLLAELAAESSTRFVFISTDLVFDGEQPPYNEHVEPAPLSEYGRTKAAAEQHVLNSSRASVVRISLLFGVAINGRPTFFDRQLEALRQPSRWTLFADEWRTPLSVRVAAAGVAAVARADHSGLLHMGGPERMSRLEMGQRAARYLGLDAAMLAAGYRADVEAAEPRPGDVSLDCSLWRGQFPQTRWPRYEEALADFDLRS